MTVNVDKAGVIFCAAFEKGYTLTSTSQIKYEGVESYFNTYGTVVVTLTNLSPMTFYNVYCYTDDMLSNKMPLSVVVASSSMARTTCCKSIVFSTTYPFVYQYSASVAEKYFSISINSRPLNTTTVRLSLMQVICGTRIPVISTAKSASVLPNSISFSPRSFSLSSTFVVRGSVVACYILTAFSRGLDTYLNSSIPLSVVRTPLTAPEMVNVSLSNDATEISIHFDSPTDEGRTALSSLAFSFNCSLIVIFPSSSSSNCRWLDNSTLIASPVFLRS